MAHYEMSLIIKAMGDSSVRSVLTRHIVRLLDNQQIMYDVNNLGLKRLPQVYLAGGEKQFEYHYIILHYDGPYENMRKIQLLVQKDDDKISCHSHRIDDGWWPPSLRIW